MANRADLQDMEINLRYRKSEKSEKASFGVLYLFKADFDSARLEGRMENGESSFYAGTQSAQLLQVVQDTDNCENE
jgi:hypothetical protein